MAEAIVEVLKADVEHMKTDIVDIKTNAKEQSIAMLSMRDSHTETRIYMNQIRESQNAMAKENKENQASMTQDAKDNQASTLEAIKTLAVSVQTLKDEPYNAWKQMNIAWKIGIGMLIISYVGGTIFGIVRNSNN